MLARAGCELNILMAMAMGVVVVVVVVVLVPVIGTVVVVGEMCHACSHRTRESVASKCESEQRNND